MMLQPEVLSNVHSSTVEELKYKNHSFFNVLPLWRMINSSNPPEIPRIQHKL